jgi:uroporphyrinogen III methyltransferase/synthase
MVEDQNKGIENSAPLGGRTIVTTRARSQAAVFTDLLERFGARVLQCPMIEIVEPESYALLDQAIEDLYGYDWIIFTSVNGVDSFLRRLIERGHEVDELDETRVCAIGQATAESLREARVHVDVVPVHSKAEGIFSALEEYLGGASCLSGLNFLIPQAAVARNYLPNTLENAGARVDVVPAYRTVPPNSSDRRRLEALLNGGGVDCITFTSSSTVINFARLFDTNDLGPILQGVAVACIGDVTASTVLDYGITCDIMPPEYTIPALASAIAHHFNPGHLRA